MIRNSPGASSYFGGGHRNYGRYQWNVKFQGFNDEFEMSAAQLWALGEHVPMKSGKGRHFEYLSELVGREVEAYLEGRSGGWLSVHTELSEAELTKIDGHVKACLKGLPEFLREERELRELDRLDALAEVPTTIRAALERAETALKYGPDMASSKVAALEDAISLLSTAVLALKGATHV